MKKHHWKQLPGKRTYHPLVPAMLNGEYPKTMETTLVPKSENLERKSCTVVFDRDYAIEKVRRDFTGPLKDCQLEELLKLMLEAWRVDHPEPAADDVLAQILTDFVR